jgi:hypothetical protein
MSSPVQSTRRLLKKGCRKTLSESFDMAQDERRRFAIVDDFPFC